VTGPVLYGALGTAAAGHFAGEAALAAFYARLRGVTQLAVLVAQAALVPVTGRRLTASRALVLAPILTGGAAAALGAAPGLAAAAVAMALARVVDAAVETPAERLAQSLLPRGVRGRAGAFLDGVTKRLGAVAGGGAVAAVAAWHGGAAALGWLGAGVAALWLGAAALLARRYGRLAVAELERRPPGRAERDEPPRVDDAARAVLARDLAGVDDARRERAIDLIAAARPDVAATELARAAAGQGAPAARRRLLEALDALAARGVVPAPGPALDEALAALLERLAGADLQGGTHAAAVRAFGRLASATAFERARPRLETLAASDGALELRLAAAAALARRAGDAAAIDHLVDDVLAASPAARQAAAEALLRGRPRPEPPPGAVVAALAELRLELAGAGDERRARLAAWLVAVAHGGPPGTLAPALGALAAAARAGLPADALRDAVELAVVVAGDELALDAARVAAAELLGAGGGARVAPALARLLDDADADVRAAAADGLAALGPPALPALLVAVRFGRRAARDGALAVLRELRASPGELDDIIDGELVELARAAAHRAALAGRPASPALELLRLRLGDRFGEGARTLLLLAEVRSGDPQVGVVAERWYGSDDRRVRARALEALEALLPGALAARLVAAIEDVPDDERARRAAAVLGGAAAAAPDAEAVLRAELDGGDALARRLAVRALGAAGRAAHRDAIRAAARRLPSGIHAVRVLKRIADSDEEIVDMPSNVDTMAALRALPLFRALSARELADVAAAVAWQDAAPGAVLVGERDGDGEALYLVASGRVRVEPEGGGAAVELGAGQGFGEGALLRGGPPPARATVVERAVVGRLGRAALERLVDDAPRLGLALCRGLLLSR
jgi:hypothetical protein